MPRLRLILILGLMSPIMGLAQDHESHRPKVNVLEARVSSMVEQKCGHNAQLIAGQDWTAAEAACDDLLDFGRRGATGAIHQELNLLTEIYLRQERWSEVRDAYRDLAKDEKPGAYSETAYRYRQNLVIALVHLGQVQEAAERLNQVAKIGKSWQYRLEELPAIDAAKPESVLAAAYVVRSRSLAQSTPSWGQIKDAPDLSFADFLEADRLCPGTLATDRLLGEWYTDHGEWEKAIPYLKRYLSHAKGETWDMEECLETCISAMKAKKNSR